MGGGGSVEEIETLRARGGGPYYTGSSFADIYNALLADLMWYGRRVSPRGMLTVEIPAVAIALTNPRSRLAFRVGRKFNLAFAFAEFLWISQRRDDLAFMQRYNRRFADFSDDGVKLWGAYGARMLLDEVVAKLTRDPDSRQAVSLIWRPEDVRVESKDIPCTVAWQFFIRSGSLEMITMMRSNDVVWGLPYDLFTNTLIQEWVAQTLGVGIGPYWHFAGSMHLYERHFGLAKGGSFDPVEMPPMPPGFQELFRAVEIAVRAGDLEDDDAVRSLGTPEEMDLAFVLKAYEANRRGDREQARRLAAMLREWARPIMEDFIG